MPATPTCWDSSFRASQGVRRQAGGSGLIGIRLFDRHDHRIISIWGWIADKWGRKARLYPDAADVLPLFRCLRFGAQLAFLIGARFLAGLGIGGAVPVDASILAEFAPARVRGYSTGAMPIAWPVSTFIVSAPALCTSAMGLAGTVFCLCHAGLADLLDPAQRAGISHVAGQSRAL